MPTMSVDDVVRTQETSALGPDAFQCSRASVGNPPTSTCAKQAGQYATPAKGHSRVSRQGFHSRDEFPPTKSPAK